MKASEVVSARFGKILKQARLDKQAIDLDSILELIQQYPELAGGLGGAGLGAGVGALAGNTGLGALLGGGLGAVWLP